MAGEVFITLAFIFGFTSLISYFALHKTKIKNIFYPRVSFYLALAFVLLSSIALLINLINHNYQLAYVYNYSDNSLSWSFLISSFYAGQEGSYLLWISLLLIFTAIFRKLCIKDEDIECVFMLFQIFGILLLMFMSLPILQNPFITVWDNKTLININNINHKYYNILSSFFVGNGIENSKYIKLNSNLLNLLKLNGISPKEIIINGNGLNQLLKNFWMQIHPPFLFMGFALCLFPFSMSLTYIILKKDEIIYKYLPKFLLVIFLTLSLAIISGSYWAYSILGWGGYWGWDPVENSCLVPWLISLAFLHFLKVKTEFKYIKQINIVLSLILLISVLYSTFLTRSGILQNYSVHSFVNVNGAVYYYLFLIVLLSLFSISIYYSNSTANNKNKNVKIGLNFDFICFLTSLLILLSGAVVTLGTSLPIIGKSVENSFYENINAVLLMFLFTLQLLYGNLGKNFLKASNSLKYYVINIIISSVVTLILCVFLEIWNPIYILLLAFSFIAVVSNLFSFTILKIGSKLAHIGFATVIIGIVLSASLTDIRRVNIVKGGTCIVGKNFKMKFNNYKVINNSKIYCDIDILTNKTVYKAFPEIVVSSSDNSISFVPYIVKQIITDIHVIPVYFEKRGSSDILICDFEIKPFINLIWIGSLIMAIGILLSIIKSNKLTED